jgi:(p)ppGpp synthase/HD superfamily hydrolase
MSAEEVQAALLHDVIEDVEELEQDWNTLSIRDVESEFSSNTISMVDDCSRAPEVSRDDFMVAMKGLTWPSKVIKCLDRLHNLIRAFSITDASYIERYILETKEVYLPAFENMDELSPVRNLFYDVLSELEKYYETIKN